MRIKRLSLKNIGPFKEATLDFPVQCKKESGEIPVTIITGNNGAGKSIIIDAIRTALGGDVLERNIVANEDDFKITLCVNYDGSFKTLETNEFVGGAEQSVDWFGLGILFLRGYDLPGKVYNWVLDYWTTRQPTDGFSIGSMNHIQNEKVLSQVLSGGMSNMELTNFICQVDYLRTSEMPQEKELGAMMYDKLKTIVNLCLDGGKFKYVRRADLTPIVEQNGVDLSLDKLSAGNIFLLEHLALLLCKFYSVATLNNVPTDKMFKIPGLLLIDEVENHMHPIWQKRIVGIVRTLFPNLQIILTTHSPFVVASADGARIYTCVSSTGFSEVRDETDKYSHLPVEEVLQSPVFNVNPFNEDIARLMSKRKHLIELGRVDEAQEVAKELYKINPEYFSYLGPSL